MQLNKENFIKSPFNYTGGKYKLLDQLLPLFPKDIYTFYDLFAGGANVAVNVKAKKIIANDIQHQVIQFLQACKNYSSDYILQKINYLIDKYNLSKTNAEGYYKLRNYYNKENRDSIVFYTLTCYAFNQMIRFNKKGEYTYSFGKDRSSFNPKIRENLINFIDKLKEININFYNKSYNEFNIEEFKQNDFVYLDPPYLITNASYNKVWREQQEKELLNFLDKLNEKGIRFALSNVIIHKGKENIILKKWSENYYVNDLDYSYDNCIYHKNSRGSSKEVLITNYKTKNNEMKKAS